MELIKFLNIHEACKEGREWAIATGATTIEEVWLNPEVKGEWRTWIAQRTLPARTLQLFACRAVRTIWHLLTDERSRAAFRIADALIAASKEVGK